MAAGSGIGFDLSASACSAVLTVTGKSGIEQFLEFNHSWMEAVLPYLIEGGILGTFIDWRGLPIAHTAAIALGLAPLNLIVWAKTNAGMGSLYRSAA